MLLSKTLLAFCTVPLIIAPMPAPAQLGCPNFLGAEPYVIFDVTGSTLSGFLHSHLTVYSNGFVTRSSTGGNTGLTGATVQTDFLSPDLAIKLRRDLALAGATTLCDQTISVSDIPLTTLTILNGGTDARAHTFSYWVAFEEYAGVSQVISDFIADNL